MPADDFLSGISRAMEAAAERRERERAEFNANLGEPILFLPFPDTPGHGIGWFRGDTGFFAYTRYSNGYNPNSRVELADELLRALIPHMPRD